MTPDELLDRAADEMIIRGSCAGRLEDNDGSVCMIGAVQKAHYRYAGNFDTHTRAMNTLVDTLRERVVVRWSPNMVADWSDGHTHDERIEALRIAAKHYREQSQQ